MTRRAKCSLESQIENAQSQSIHQWKHAEVSGVEADVQHQRDREHRHEYMRRYCEQLYIRSHECTLSKHLVVDDCPMDERGVEEHPVQDDCSMVNVHDAGDTWTPYLPVHQEQALYEFLDCLHLIQDDMHECTTCLERYHGMQMCGTECARCYNEVHIWWVQFSFC